MNKRKIGNIGEDLAVRYLRNDGYEIVARNYRFQRGEIDIVARENRILVFVEVKSRRTKSYGEPEDSVTIRKRRQIHKVAEGFLYENNIQNTECRFDVISIFFEGGKAVIKHFKNAFQP
jgi:putative endonuclease